MDLSIDLIKEFAKTTNDEPVINKGSTAYGRYILQGDKAFVEIDGSNGALTPVATTSTVKNNDRVTVLIKDHTAIVTGNLTDPSASSDDVENVKKTMGTATLDIEDLKEKLSNQEITLKEYETAIEDAKRVATDYIDFTAGTGLVIGSTSISNNVRIYSGGIDIREGENILASYTGDKISLGANSLKSTISLCSEVGYISAVEDEQYSLHELLISSAGHLKLQSRSGQCGVMLGGAYTLEINQDEVSFYKSGTVDVIWAMSSERVTLGPYGVSSPRMIIEQNSGKLKGNWDINANDLTVSGTPKFAKLSNEADDPVYSSYKLVAVGTSGIIHRTNTSLKDLVDGSMKVTAVFG